MNLEELRLERTSQGREVWDGDELVAIFTTWPPQDEEGLKDLFDHGDVDPTLRDMFLIMTGKATEEKEQQDEQS